VTNLLDDIKKLPYREYGSGEAVIYQGAGDGRVYVLASGSVEVVKDDVQIAVVSEVGAIFGEMSLLLKEPATANVRTLEPSIFHVVEDPADFLRTHPEVSFYMAELLARRLDSLNKYLVDVKNQFKQYDDHVGMIDEVLETLMSKHPRRIERRRAPEYD
jgi:CRP-like cAMP-binding protein